MNARSLPVAEDLAPRELVGEVRAALDARRIPCPDCGTPMVSARGFSARVGAFIGVACTVCSKLYHVGGGQDEEGSQPAMTVPGAVEELRKNTVFEPCPLHASMYASVDRRRRAEVMVEGGWAGSLCADVRCRMKPGTDFFTADFVRQNAVYEVGQ